MLCICSLLQMREKVDLESCIANFCQLLITGRVLFSGLFFGVADAQFKCGPET